MDFIKGKFLISNSALKEKSFAETVLFIIEHNEEGAFGLVVNRPESENYLDELPSLKNERGITKIYNGGPVRTDVIFVLFMGDENVRQEDGEKIIDGVYMGTSFQLLEKLIEEKAPFHIYHGYAGWAPGQLEKELESKTWVVMPAKKEIIFHEKPEIVWREVLFEKGGIYSYFARNIKDPFLN